jgi:hypothetical protein
MAPPRRRRLDGKQVRSAGAPRGEPDWRASYELVDPDEVEKYVRRHPFLVPLLIEAPDRITDLFGPHSGLVLEAPVFSDDGTQHLYLTVRTSNGVDVARTRRERLEEGWWLDAMRQARARMTVDIELV